MNVNRGEVTTSKQGQSLVFNAVDVVIKGLIPSRPNASIIKESRF